MDEDTILTDLRKDIKDNTFYPNFNQFFLKLEKIFLTLFSS